MVTTHNDLDYDEIVQKLVQMADAFDRDFCQAGPVLRFEMEAHFRYLLCLAEASLANFPWFERDSFGAKVDSSCVCGVGVNQTRVGIPSAAPPLPPNEAASGGVGMPLSRVPLIATGLATRGFDSEVRLTRLREVSRPELYTHLVATGRISGPCWHPRDVTASSQAGN
ncbi:unnamed protein product [Mesocestoides corti]|uniref:Uncharacterized protein n=1 Tax=Mesocestoides corti TaxID=53468 RepID=A0A0R3UPC4_MESCO|nr:unnamed protein product [Mesocestoides corti]